MSRNWRTSFDAEPDYMRRADILEAIAEVSELDSELLDILCLMAQLPPGLHNRIVIAVNHRRKSLNRNANIREAMTAIERTEAEILRLENILVGMRQKQIARHREVARQEALL